MCADLALNTAHRLQVMHMQLFEMENEEPVCGGWVEETVWMWKGRAPCGEWRGRRLCACVEGEGPLQGVVREEANAWAWKERGLCGEW